jgi:hypothetical protein
MGLMPPLRQTASYLQAGESAVDNEVENEIVMKIRFEKE